MWTHTEQDIPEISPAGAVKGLKGERERGREEREPETCSMKVMDTHRGSLRTRHPGAASETRLPSRTGEPGWSGRTRVSLKWTSCHDE